MVGGDMSNSNSIIFSACKKNRSKSICSYISRHKNLFTSIAKLLWWSNIDGSLALGWNCEWFPWLQPSSHPPGKKEGCGRCVTSLFFFNQTVRALTWYLHGAPVAVATAICAYWLIGLLYPTAERGLLLTWVGALGIRRGETKDLVYQFNALRLGLAIKMQLQVPPYMFKTNLPCHLPLSEDKYQRCLVLLYIKISVSWKDRAHKLSIACQVRLQSPCVRLKRILTVATPSGCTRTDTRAD